MTKECFFILKSLITGLELSNVYLNKIYTLRHMINVTYIGTYDLLRKWAEPRFVTQGLEIPRRSSKPKHTTVGKIWISSSYGRTRNMDGEVAGLVLVGEKTDNYFPKLDMLVHKWVTKEKWEIKTVVTELPRCALCHGDAMFVHHRLHEGGNVRAVAMRSLADSPLFNFRNYRNFCKSFFFVSGQPTQFCVPSFAAAYLNIKRKSA